MNQVAIKKCMHDLNLERLFIDGCKGKDNPNFKRAEDAVNERRMDKSFVEKAKKWGVWEPDLTAQSHPNSG